MKIFKSKKAYNMKGHILIGLVSIALLWYLNSIYGWVELPTDNKFYLQIITIVIIYALLPDSDQPGSIINKYITVILGGIAILAFLGYLQASAGIFAIAAIVALRMVGHRKIIHSALFALLASLPLYYFLGPIYFVVGLVAYISHIIADNEFSWGWEKDHKMKFLK